MTRAPRGGVRWPRPPPTSPPQACGEGGGVGCEGVGEKGGGGRRWSGRGTRGQRRIFVVPPGQRIGWSEALFGAPLSPERPGRHSPAYRPAHRHTTFESRSEG